MGSEITLSRREVLRRAALVLGVSALSPGITSAVMAGAAAEKGAKPRFLTTAQLRLVATLTEMILPTTDTPGAEAAGVHHYIDVLLSDYLLPARRDNFMKGLADVDARARALGFRNFLAATAEARLEIATALDREAYAPVEAASDEVELAGRRLTDAPEETPLLFFRELKELTLTGYYTSEVGATRELAYDPIPGKYEGCVPYKTLGRAWAT